MWWRYVALVALVVMGVSTSAAAETEWQIDPPPGWRRNSALEKQFNAGRGAIRSVQSELRLWMPVEANAMLMMDWYVVDLKHRTDQEIIETLDSTTLTGPGITARADKPERNIAGLVIRDSTAMSSGMLARHVRHYLRATDGLHVLTAMCTAREMDLCNASLDGARLRIASAAPARSAASPSELDDPGDAAGARRNDDKPSTYRIGQIVGIIGLLALGLALLFRKRR